MTAKEPLQKGTCHKSTLSRHSYGDEAASVHMMMIMVIIMAMITVVLVIVGVVMLSMKQLSQQLCTRISALMHRPRTRQRIVCRCILHVLVGLTVHAAAMTQLNIVLVTTVVNYTISSFHQSLQFRFYFVEFSYYL